MSRDRLPVECKTVKDGEETPCVTRDVPLFRVFTTSQWRHVFRFHNGREIEMHVFN
jgi:hypothetical protein